MSKKPFAKVVLPSGKELLFFGMVDGWALPEDDDGTDAGLHFRFHRARFMYYGYHYSPADGYPGVQHVNEVAKAIGGKAEILEDTTGDPDAIY